MITKYDLTEFIRKWFSEQGEYYDDDVIDGWFDLEDLAAQILIKLE